MLKFLWVPASTFFSSHVMNWPSVNAFIPGRPLSSIYRCYPNFISGLSITWPYQRSQKVASHGDLKLSKMQKWNNCLPYKKLVSPPVSPNLINVPTICLLNDKVNKPVSYPWPKSFSHIFFQQIRRQRLILNPSLLIPNKMDVYLYLCLCAQVIICKKNFSRTLREHLLVCED